MSETKNMHSTDAAEQSDATKENIIGIMGAMECEIKLLKDCMDDPCAHKISGNTFYTGTLEGVPVVLVRSGIGKVNAAITTQILINQFNVSKIIFTGVAGGIHEKLDILDVVISTRLVQHDYDTTALGDKPCAVEGSQEGYFKADRLLVKQALLAAYDEIGTSSVHQGTIATGDQFIACKETVKALAEQFDAWAVEMEGAAMAHAATLAEVPFVVIRAISDKANGEAPDNFTQFANRAAVQSEKIIRYLMKNFFSNSHDN